MDHRGVGGWRMVVTDGSRPYRAVISQYLSHAVHVLDRLGGADSDKANRGVRPALPGGCRPSPCFWMLVVMVFVCP